MERVLGGEKRNKGNRKITFNRIKPSGNQNSLVVGALQISEFCDF